MSFLNRSSRTTTYVNKTVFRDAQSAIAKAGQGKSEGKYLYSKASTGKLKVLAQGKSFPFSKLLKRAAIKRTNKEMRGALKALLVEKDNSRDARVIAAYGFFLDKDLNRVDTQECLKHLSALAQVEKESYSPKAAPNLAAEFGLGMDELEKAVNDDARWEIASDAPNEFAVIDKLLSGV